MVSRNDVLHAFLCLSTLRIDAADLGSLGNTGDGQHISSQAQITAKVIGLGSNSIKAAIHNHFQFFGNLLHAPEEALQILYPLEVADGNSTSIGQNIRDHHTALLEENGIGFRGGRTISGFRNNPGLHPVGIGRCDHTLSCGWHQDITGYFQHLLNADVLRVREIDNGATFLLVTQNHCGVEASLVIDAPTRITYSDNLAALVMEETCGNPTRIAIALNTHARTLERHPHPAGCAPGHKEHTSRGSVIATLAAPNGERLASDYSRNGEPPVHGIGIHHPRHHLRVGIDIWCGNVTMRTNNNGYFSRITTGQAF